MDNGRIVEFDTPRNLLQKEGGVFQKMYKDSGELEEAAKGTYQKDLRH